MSRNANETFFCNVFFCVCVFFRERLKGHVNRVHDLPFDYSCDICDRPEVGGTGGGGKFKSLLKLTKHRISAHKINGEGVVCENCGSLVLSEGKYHSIHRPACKR